MENHRLQNLLMQMKFQSEEFSNENSEISDVQSKNKKELKGAKQTISQLQEEVNRRDRKIQQLDTEKEEQSMAIDRFKKLRKDSKAQSADLKQLPGELEWRKKTAQGK